MFKKYIIIAVILAGSYYYISKNFSLPFSSSSSICLEEGAEVFAYIDDRWKQARVVKLSKTNKGYFVYVSYVDKLERKSDWVSIYYIIHNKN